jgi:hypothetical protein
LLFESFSCHEQELNELFIAFLVLSNIDYHHIHRWVTSLDETFNSFSKHVLIELSFTKLSPNFRFSSFFSEGLGSFQIALLLEEDFDCFDIFSKLLVNAESFIVELILIFLSNFCELLSIVVIKSVNVVHNSALISLNSCQNK